MIQLIIRFLKRLFYFLKYRKMNNTTFPFYRSTAMQDANRFNTSYVRTCPRNRLLPFQIETDFLTSTGVTAVSLVDCDGNATSLATGYFASIGTSISTGSLGFIPKSASGYIQYDGGPLETLLPYGVYYLKVVTANASFYSENFRVEDINPNLLTYATTWTNAGFDTFITSENSISTASISTGSASAFMLESYDTNKGDKFIFECDIISNSGAIPIISWGDTSVQLIDGRNSVELETAYQDNALELVLDMASAGSFSMPWCRFYKNYGNYVKIQFSNSSDLRHSKNTNILYATGGFNQVVYLNTKLNNPIHEYVEVGEEREGEFIPEELNSTFIYNIVDYVSRSVYAGLQYLPMHDSITITDEVGNEYNPDAGNVQVSMEWTTHDTGTVRISFNDGAMDWVNDQSPIT